MLFRSYLEPARGRANLAIVGNAVVDTLTFEGNRAHANGVTVRIGGEVQTLDISPRARGGFSPAPRR